MATQDVRGSGSRSTSDEGAAQRVGTLQGRQTVASISGQDDVLTWAGRQVDRVTNTISSETIGFVVNRIIKASPLVVMQALFPDCRLLPIAVLYSTGCVGARCILNKQAATVEVHEHVRNALGIWVLSRVCMGDPLVPVNVIEKRLIPVIQKLAPAIAKMMPSSGIDKSLTYIVNTAGAILFFAVERISRGKESTQL